MDRLGVLELQANQLEDAAYKNRFIRECQEDYLAFVDRSKISEVELAQMVQEEDMLACGDVLVFCAGEAQDAVELSFENIPECFWLQIAGVVFARKLLADAGSYNERLQGMTDFELVCRLAKANGRAIFVFPGFLEDAPNWNQKDAFTCAYVLRRYMKDLQAWNKMEGILQQLCTAMEQCGVLPVFKQSLQHFLGSQDAYEQIAIATAPFVILRGDETCFGVLQDFADCLYAAIRKSGQACILAENGKTDYEQLMNHVSKAIVGFQSKAFKMEFFKSLHGPKFQFWFDNPVFYEFHFDDLDDDCNILCHDSNYVEFIREQYQKENARLFPPAGHELPWAEECDRPYDIVFIGSYIPEASENLEGLEREFYEYMLEHPDITFAEGMRAVMNTRNEPVQVNISACFAEIKHICQSVINHYRRKVMETILAAGYEVHVYGESWNAYESSYAHRLIRHPELTVAESIGEWQKAKIGLNVMSWHKAGMTERIANIMLCGAVCLSEETDYLKEHFAEGEEIVTFKLSQLEKLPEQIRQLLNNDNWRRVSRKGYEIASREHTWERRALQLLEVVENII